MNSVVTSKDQLAEIKQALQPNSLRAKRLLRQRAESIVLEKAAQLARNLDGVSAIETPQMQHELRVHQIELEMQNDELRRLQIELEAARTRYFDLYDLAPVGYCTVSEEGMILEANLAAASLLGIAKNRLIKRPFSQFILKQDQCIFYLCLKRLLASDKTQPCELRMIKRGGATFWASLDVNIVQAVTDDSRLTHVILTDISERKQTQIQLEKSLTALQAALLEKELLMLEVHHRVKNNLQMMSALLELQSGYVADEKIRGYFKDCQQRIQSMAMIHEQLYHNENISKIDFAAYLHTLLDSLILQYGERCKRIKITIDAAECILPVDIAIPCGLVVNELASNVFKHAFPGDVAGELCVSLRYREPGKLILSVSDDGVGLPPSMDIHNCQSFGLQVIALMVEEQLEGRLSVETSVNHGTRIVCEIGVQA